VIILKKNEEEEKNLALQLVNSIYLRRKHIIRFVCVHEWRDKRQRKDNERIKGTRYTNP
jgi:hypothetical protein